jgi:hypothetical protein
MIWSYSSHLHRKATPVHSSPDCLTFWSYFPMACWLVIGSCLHIHICTLSLSNQRASGNIVEILIKILPKTTMNSLKEMMFAGWSYVLLNVNFSGVHVTVCHYYIPLLNTAILWDKCHWKVFSWSLLVLVTLSEIVSCLWNAESRVGFIMFELEENQQWMWMLWNWNNNQICIDLI